ncbi:MAG: hypothetical protein K6T90_04055 [Leptolyngbyaceae cyanobacterium HOT.MB2.61]|nr:hypothetical protein [Leptolyngbyaceae cyanobacterium HOT.MB2.61]
MSIRVLQHMRNFVGERVNTLTSHVLTVDKSVTLLESYPLFAISQHKRSGLILCQPHYAEFAGPGAAVSTLVDQNCVAIIAIGSPEIVELASHDERQRAYSRRIQWIRWIQKITDHSDPIQRVEKLLSGFEAFFGNQVLASLSDDVLGLLAGVLPQTIAIARSQHRPLGSTNSPEPGPIVTALNPQTLQAFREGYTPVSVSASYIEKLSNLPCLA